MFFTNIHSKICNAIYVLLIAVVVFCQSAAFAAERDTILNTVYSKPFIYNVLKDNKGVVYAGTSEGIFRINGSSLVFFNRKDGYITLNAKGAPVVNPEGIKNHNETKYMHLLPFPALTKQEYHAGTEDYFYISSGGRIYVYDVVPYRYSYANHSIRSITTNYTGTYSGIYYKGQKLNRPVSQFTDGYIREYEGMAFVCYDWMQVLKPAKAQTGKTDSSVQQLYDIKCAENKVQFRDVFKAAYDRQYYVSSLTCIAVLQQKLDSAVVIYKSKDIASDISIIGENKGSLYFTDNNYVLKYGMRIKSFDTIAQLPEPILDGSIDNRNLYLLTSNGCYQLNSDNSFNKLITLSKAHTMELISGTEMVIATDNGLFWLNTVSKTLEPLIVGVEFNRRALFIENDILHAGSINGLYSINSKDFPLLISKNRSGINRSTIPSYVYIGLLMVAGIIGWLLFLFIRERKKAVAATTQVKELNVETLTREKIEAYIQENLSTASLKSMIDYFNSNKNQIYKLIEPEKPGSIIQHLRMQKVLDMRKAGADIHNISQVTGFSESYIKKIRKKEA